MILAGGSRLHVGLFLLAATAVTMTGCGEKSVTTPRRVTSDGQAAGSASAVVDVCETPSADAEAARFAKEFEKTLANGDIVAFTAAIDFAVVMRRAMRDCPEEVRQVSAEGVKALQGGIERSDAGLVKKLAAKGHYRFLRTRRQGNEQQAIFRMTTTQGAINYLEFTLVLDAAGDVRVGDVHSYAQCGTLSNMFRQHCLCLAAANAELFQRYSIVDRNYVVHVNDVKEMEKLVATKRFEDALRLYETMPTTLQNHKEVLRQRLLAGRHLDGGQFDQTVEAIQAVAPDEPGYVLMAMDYYFLRRRYDESIATVDRLDQLVGGDPLLDGYRAIVHIRKGNLALARKLAQSAAKIEPDSPIVRGAIRAITNAEKAAPK